MFQALECYYYRPKAAITHMCASNGVLILATAVNSLQRICIDPKQTIEGNGFVIRELGGNVCTDNLLK
jgi:hypothetical protein